MLTKVILIKKKKIVNCVFFNKPEKEKESKQKPTKLSAGKECYKKKTSVSPVKTRNIKKK